MSENERKAVVSAMIQCYMVHDDTRMTTDLIEALADAAIAALRHSQAGGAVVFSLPDRADGMPAYISHHGSVCVDWDADPQRQFALIVKPDGSVAFAAYVAGKKWSGDAMGESFRKAMQAWSTPTPASEAVRVDASVLHLFDALVHLLPAPNPSYSATEQNITQAARAESVRRIRTALAAAIVEPVGEKWDMLAHLTRQREWSGRTFGPGARTAGVVDHIRKELREIEADPADVSEWIDVVILALDGAWRAGYQPQQIIDALAAKQAKNEARVWPDWRTMPADKAIEHDRSHDQPTAIPAGEFVMVPREPTPKMIDATWNHAIDQDGGIESQNTRNVRIYRAMLAAAPKDGGA